MKTLRPIKKKAPADPEFAERQAEREKKRRQYRETEAMPSLQNRYRRAEPKKRYMGDALPQTKPVQRSVDDLIWMNRGSRI